MPKIGSAPSVLTPFWQTTDGNLVRLYRGDVIETLKRLPAKSVQCTVTSPPYWGLRDYGTAVWEGGDTECDHKRVVGDMAWDATKPKPGFKSGFRGSKSRTDHVEEPSGVVCNKCGAIRVADGQLGSEPTPEEFVANMVAVFREVHRVLRDDGTLWLNLGDTYGGGPPGGQSDKQDTNKGSFGAKRGNGGIKSGNLVGIPWRVALALQADGWILRQDVIWHKPSPMPESVRNRCTKAHEYVFLFVKKSGYFYDAEAIRETSLHAGKSDKYRNSARYVDQDELAANQNHEGQTGEKGTIPEQRNKRSVWTICSESYPGSHFATFPRKLVEPCILAGTSEKGACANCGTPWKRVTEETKLTRERPNDYVKRTGEAGTGNSAPNSAAGIEVKTIGWEPGCDCFLTKDRKCKDCGADWASEQSRANVGDWGSKKRGLDYSETGMNINVLGGQAKYNEYAKQQASKKVVQKKNPCDCFSNQVIPCTVLDPFVGSGTTCCVAIDLGRRSLGIDLSEKYLTNNAIPRIEGELLNRPALAALSGKGAKKLNLGKKV